MSNEFKLYRLAYTMRFVRSVILATAFLYVLSGIMSFIAGDNIGLAICSLRIGIVIFILSIYALSYTEMFRAKYEYLLSIYVIVNSITLLLMGILTVGLDNILMTQLSLMPTAMVILVLNYILPMEYKVSAVSGILASLPYMIVSIIGGTVNHIITTFMMLLAINVLMSLNSYSNEKMVAELWMATVDENYNKIFGSVR